MIDLLNITPHQVSRDLRGYSVFFYGEPKSGKTTIATKFPNHLLLAFEKGYNTIAGAMAQPVNSWSEFRKALRQLEDLKRQRNKATEENDTATLKKLPNFETIIIDTADIAYNYCEKYICENAPRSDGGFGVDSIGDIPYGKGYGLVANEFDECLRKIVQMDYGLILISHSTDKTFTDEAGHEYNQIVPTLDKRARNIVSRMADIIGYSRVVKDKEGNEAPKLFMRGTTRYIAGSRFKYTPPYIDFNYQSLVNAIGEALDKQAKEDGEEYFTDTRNNLYVEETLDFDELMKEFKNTVNGLIQTVSRDEYETYWKPRIVQIREHYLGKGVQLSEIDRGQVEALDLIIHDIKELIKNK